MANQEEQDPTNEHKEQGSAAADHTENTGQDTSSSSTGKNSDPVHNTGNDRMMIDEEGAEIKPGDEV